MSNMSYCRFNNTLSDLLDCQEALEAYQHETLSPTAYEKIEAEIDELDSGKVDANGLDRLRDLCDDIKNHDENDIVGKEKEKAIELIRLCKTIADEYYDDLDSLFDK